MQARQPHARSEEALLATAFSGRLVDTAAQLCACPPVVLDLADVQVPLHTTIIPFQKEYISAAVARCAALQQWLAGKHVS